MSINAIVSAVNWLPDGMCDLELEAVDSQPAGQQRLTVINPHPQIDVMIGMRIWGGADTIMIGNRMFAKRVGATMIRLLESQAKIGKLSECEQLVTDIMWPVDNDT